MCIGWYICIFGKHVYVLYGLHVLYDYHLFTWGICTFGSGKFVCYKIEEHVLDMTSDSACMEKICLYVEFVLSHEIYFLWHFTKNFSVLDEGQTSILPRVSYV
jgi:hypothetical protein